MPKFLLLIILSVFFYNAEAGIYRHDVSIDKYQALANQSQFDCVGMVFKDYSLLAGSCVLISDRFVLCAAHVFVESKTVPDSISVGERRIVVFKQLASHQGETSNYSFVFKHKRYKANSIKLFPAYLDSTTKGTCDLALIELTEVPSSVQPAILGYTATPLNGIVTGVGFGASGPSNKPEEVGPWMEHIAGQNKVDSVSGFIYQGRPTVLMSDFDSPTDKTCCNQTGKAEALPLEYAPSGGDSGGGAFIQTSKGWELVGICTGTQFDVELMIKTHSYYGEQIEWTFIAPFKKWIEAEMK